MPEELIKQELIIISEYHWLYIATIIYSLDIVSSIWLFVPGESVTFFHGT